MIDNTRQNIICYSHPPISPGVQFIHQELFHLINVFKTKYNVFVVSRSKECYDMYMERFAPQHPEVNFVPVPDDQYDETTQTYMYGKLRDNIEKATSGRIDKAFVFSAGMTIVTPEEYIRDFYQLIDKGRSEHPWKGSYKDFYVPPQDWPTMHEAEFLHTVIRHKPKFYHRVVDYTEPRLDRATGYPMKLLSYYATPSLGHKKFHDSELFFVSDQKEKVEKNLDFLFGFTVEVPGRAYMTEFAFQHIKQTDKVKLCIKDKYYSKYAPINASMRSDKYYDLLRHAKFSLIAPSTNPTELSLYRVYDDLAAYCIPLFMRSVQYWKGFEDDMNEFIRKNLIYDEGKWPTLNDFIASLDHEKLYNEIMSLESMKKNSNKEWIYEKILEEID